MNKTISAISAAALITLGMATPVAAQSDNAAQIVADAGCNGFVPTADGGFGPFIFTPDGAHAVATSSGNVTLICQFDIPEGLEPATATQASGFGCGTYFGSTTDTKMVASPGGKATLICKTKGNS